MSKNGDDIFLGFAWPFFFSIVFANFIGFVSYVTIGGFVPATALGFAVSTQLFSEFRTRKTKSKFNSEKINILRRYCADKSSLARSMVDKQNITSLTYCIIELEFLATEISKCCDQQTDKDKFKKVKGLLGSTKTTLDKSKFDSDIKTPFSDVIQCVGELETYLNDL
ncbi:MAG: hypothetical protein AAF348_17905 [Bacteroidota bacterium]